MSPNLLTPILTPKAQITVKAKLRQVFLHNARVHYLVIIFFVFLVWIAVYVKVSGPGIYITIGVVILYFVFILGSFLFFRIILNGQSVVRKAFLKTYTYPYRDINKVILVQNLTHYDGRARSRSSGMAILLFTIDGDIPGFPFFELGHESYMTKEDILKVFNTFNVVDRVDIATASRAEVLDMINELRKGVTPKLAAKQTIVLSGRAKNFCYSQSVLRL